MKPNFLFLLILAALCVACKKDPESSAKEVLGFQVLGGSPTYPPKTTIEGTVISVGLGKEFDLSDLEYTVTVSPLAILKPGPTDLSKPAGIIVEAEDGSTVTYTVIVTQIEGEVLTQMSASTSDLREMREFYRCSGGVWGPEGIGAAFPNEGLDIQMDHCDLMGDHEDFLGIFLRNKTPGDPLAGVYPVSGGQDGLATARWASKTPTGGTAAFYTPVSGSVVITDYDVTHQTISGRFENVKFDHWPDEYPYYVLNGTFVNVQIQ